MTGLKTQLQLAIELLKLEQKDSPTENKRMALSYLEEEQKMREDKE